jgi:hypothetical protein
VDVLGIKPKLIVKRLNTPAVYMVASGDQFVIPKKFIEMFETHPCQ